MRYEDVAPVLLYETTPAVLARRVRDERADDAADSTGHGHRPKVETPRVYEVAGERHDDFRRQRYARRLDSHQQNDARVAERRDRRHDEGRQGFDYSRNQVNT